MSFKIFNKFSSEYSYFVHGFNGLTLILGNIEESEEDGTISNRKTTFSKIRIRPNSADDQVTYACEASHPALRGTATRTTSPMRSSVLLSVLCKLLYILYIVGIIEIHNHVLQIRQRSPRFTDIWRVKQ